MTNPTSQFSVGPVQYVSAVLIMIKFGRNPVAVIVTRVAGLRLIDRSEGAFVFVRVAVCTAGLMRTKVPLFGQRTDMAGFAGNRQMSATDLEMGLSIMASHRIRGG